MVRRPAVFGLIAGAIFLLLSRVDWTLPLERLFYDLSTRATLLPVPEDVLLIAIDDRSVAELGRWPWPRERHVQLLRQLADAGPAALAMDVLFIEPDPEYPQVDARLADALSKLDNSVLPVYVGQGFPGQPLREIGPLPALRQAADALGHVHVEVDSDGITRGIFLEEGVGTALTSHFALSLAALLGEAPVLLPGATSPSSPPSAADDRVRRDFFNLVPLVGPDGALPRVSYVDVVRGRVADELLRDKVLFIGATAAGIGDFVSTPVGRMSGVEFNINVFNALSRGRLVQPVDVTAGTLAGFVLIFAISVVLTRLATSRQIVYLLVAFTLLAGIALLLLQYLQLWFSPVPVMVSLLLAYTLWGWVRLYTLLGLIRGHWESLGNQPALPGGGGSSGRLGVIADDDIFRLRSVFQRARDSRALIDSAIHDLATGVLVGDVAGNVLVENRAAADLLPVSGRYASLRERVSTVVSSRRPGAAQLYDALVADREAFEFEGLTRDRQREILLRARIVDLSTSLVVIDITDTTSIKDSERKRKEALNFLSHDLRAPLTSVLALIETARAQQQAPEVSSLLDRIEQYVGANLSYAENFVQMARLEHRGAVEKDACDLTLILDEAVVPVMQLASSKSVSLVCEPVEEPVWLPCQRTQVVRAVMNLLDNAVKHSPAGSTVNIAVRPEPGFAVIQVLDRGPGIEHDEVDAIFEAFRQGNKASAGVGLGLQFVAAVASAHEGSVSVENRAEGGTCFSLRLPADTGPADSQFAGSSADCGSLAG